MKKKILSLLAAFFMLFGTSAMAQVESTLEGDVNGDGVVDIADITAVIAIIKQNAEASPTYYWYVGNGDEIVKNDPVAADIDWSKAQQITSFETLGYSANGTRITMNKTGENNVYILCPKSWSNKWQFWNVDNTIDLTTGFSEVSELLGISSFTKDGVEYDLWIFEMYAGNIAHMCSKK